MPSTYSNLKIELIATGEQSGTWGTTTNTNLGTAIEEAITGSADVSFTNGNDTTITLTDTNAAQAARNLRLNLIGSSTGAQNLILGSGCQIEKLYLVNNTLGHTITVKNTTGTGIAVPAGRKMVVYNDGTNVVNAIDYFSSLNVEITGGTINNTVIGGSTPAAGTFTQVNIPAQGDLRLEDTTGGEYVAIQAPGTLASSYTLTLPVDDGTNGQALVTDGNGVLSWSTAASGDVYGPASATNNAVARFDQTTGKLIKNSVVTIADTTGNMAGIGTISSGAITSSSLTSGRVLYAGTSGLIQDDADFTFNGTTVTMANDASISGLTVGKGGGAVASNTALGGGGALSLNTTGNENTAVGTSALATNTGGGSNTATGFYALVFNTTGANNTAYGRYASGGNTTGSNNTAVGRDSLASNTTASNNTAVGYQAGYSNTASSGVTAFGYRALYANTSGGENDAFGNVALQANTTGNYNAVLGTVAMFSNTTGSSNTAIGNRALYSNTTASENTAVGYQAGYTNSTGTRSTLIGFQAGYTANPGSSVGNTLVGWQAGYNSTGNGNTFIGVNGTDAAVGWRMTTGSKNTIIGGYSGNQGGLDIRTASNYIVLSDGDGNPRLIVDNSGYFFRSSSGSFTSGTNSWQLRADSGAIQLSNSGTGTSTVAFFYNGNGTVGTIQTSGSSTSYVTSSDYRLKENVAPMTGALGVVNQLKPVTYNWKVDGSSGQGFIAHELAAIFPDAVTGEKDAVDENGLIKPQGIDTSFLVATLTAALQEAHGLIKDLQARVDALENK